MNQSERRKFLIKYLLDEQSQYCDFNISASEMEQKRLLRSLLNVRCPAPIEEEFLQIQDAYLREESKQKGIVTIHKLQESQSDLYIWRGDITTLAVDAIVNAANSGMTGCYQPSHNCIDNCIHTYAGIELRNECNRQMKIQGHEEKTGQTKITKGYNLPCKYVIHTVGPIVSGGLNEKHKEQLRYCYQSCLQLAVENKVQSIAFCCISTGVFMFPNKEAARIAVDTVEEYKASICSKIKVVFNVFKEEDERIYEQLLCR